MQTLGPIDYIAVGFKGNDFDGSILKELSKASKDGVIRVVDLVFIIKDEDGDVIGGEYQDQSKELKAMFSDLSYADDMPLISEDDIKRIGKSMENNTAAGVLVIEQVWARGLKKALQTAGGTLVAEGRIHPEKIEEALSELAASKG